MKITNINWDNLRLFLAVARAESAQEAARRIDIDHSTLTRRIHRLEQEIGTQLFSRTSTGHQLTPAGQQFLQYIDRVENTLVRAEAEIGGGSGTLTGPVRLGATDGFGSYFIAPHLTRFCDQHPKIGVELIAAPRFVNLSKREADLAINIERPHGNSDVVCKLSDYRLRLYATREYLAKSPPSIARTILRYTDLLAMSMNLLSAQSLDGYGSWHQMPSRLCVAPVSWPNISQHGRAEDLQCYLAIWRQKIQSFSPY